MMYIADIYGKLLPRLLGDAVFWMLTYLELNFRVGHHLLNTRNMEHIKKVKQAGSSITKVNKPHFQRQLTPRFYSRNC